MNPHRAQDSEDSGVQGIRNQVSSIEFIDLRKNGQDDGENVRTNASHFWGHNSSLPKGDRCGESEDIRI